MSALAFSGFPWYFNLIDYSYLHEYRNFRNSEEYEINFSEKTGKYLADLLTKETQKAKNKEKNKNGIKSN